MPGAALTKMASSPSIGAKPSGISTTGGGAEARRSAQYRRLRRSAKGVSRSGS
jgi:hypothetical protein